MKSPCRLITAIFFFCSTSFFSQEYIDLQKKAEELYNKNLFSDALSTCEKALKLAEEKVGKQHIDYALILADLGVYKVTKSDITGGLTDLLTAEKIIQKPTLTISTAYIMLLNNIASVYMTAGMSEDAEKYFLKAIEFKKENNATKDFEYATLLGGLGEVQRSMAKYKEAEISLNASKKIFEDNSLTALIDYGVLLNNMASFYHDLANYSRAEKYYKMAAKALVKTGLGKESEDYVKCIQNLGNLYADMGAYDDAEKYFLEAKQIKSKIYGEESFDYSTILNDLAYLYHHTGQYPKSEETYLKTLKLKGKIIGEDHDSYLRTKQNLGMLYYNLGRVKNAEKILEQVVEKVRMNKKEDPLMYTDYIENLGCIYIGNKKFVPAEKLLKEALESYKTMYGENHPEYIRALNNLAFLYSEKGEINEAKKSYELCLKISESNSLGNQSNLITSYVNMASIYKKEKQYQNAEAYLLKSLEVSKKMYTPFHPEHMHLLVQLAIVYAEEDKIKEAEDLYTKVIDANLERLKADFLFMTEAEKADFIIRLEEYVNSFYAFGYKVQSRNPGITEKVVDYRLATKALLLNTQSKLRKNIIESEDTILKQNYAQLKKANQYLSKLYSFSSDEILATGINIDSLQTEANLLEKKISAQVDFGKQKRITWKDIQKNLKDDEAAIEIIRTDSAFYDVAYSVCIITRAIPRPLVFVLEEGKNLEGKYLTEYRSNIRQKRIDTTSYAIFADRILASTPVKKIYFSADGVFNQININTLLNNKTGRYVLEDYEISFLTNTVDVLTKKKDNNTMPPAGSYAALFGYPDYTMALEKPKDNFSDENLLALSREGARGKWTLPALPGTKTEVEEINKVLTGNKINAKLFLADRSDEATIKKTKNPYILHVATHGFFQSNLPRTSESRDVPDALKRAAENPLMRSGLMLAGASNSYYASYGDVASWDEYEDGILTAYEAMNLDLDSTEVVVLSACQTGLGEIKNGEGVYGLQRSLLIAGAKSVIMSLWSVSDNATRDLMITFYDTWLRTGDKQGAFKQAQLEIRKKYIHPYFWGAFVLLEK